MIYYVFINLISVDLFSTDVGGFQKHETCIKIVRCKAREQYLMSSADSGGF